MSERIPAMRDEGALSKTETAYTLLRRDILAARLRPGSALKLGALHEAYGVGWTPLREALSRLEAEHFVTSINNRGFAVAPVSRTELEDLTRARLVVEVPLLIESMKQGGDEWEAALVVAHHRLSRCREFATNPSDEAVDDWHEKHEAFHTALLGAATSNWLLRLCSTLSDQLRRHHRFLGLTPTLAANHTAKEYDDAKAALSQAVSIEHHTALMQTALDRDFEKATTLMTEHIGFTLRVFGHAEGCLPWLGAELSGS